MENMKDETHTTPIKTGEWISVFDEDEFKCSKCGKEVLYPFIRKIKKCPRCGAIMKNVQ